VLAGGEGRYHYMESPSRSNRKNHYWKIGVRARIKYPRMSGI